jgi:hypothetical protein
VKATVTAKKKSNPIVIFFMVMYLFGDAKLVFFQQVRHYRVKPQVHRFNFAGRDILPIFNF